MNSYVIVNHKSTIVNPQSKDFGPIAMLFILFDIEMIFFFPFALVYRQLGLFGLIEMGVFVLILLVGYIYIWKRGALQWD